MIDLAIFSCEATPSAIGQRIRSFGRLPAGWHYGDGRAATNAALSLALTVAELLPDGNDVEAFPGVDGGILLSAFHGNETLEVRCEPDGGLDFWHEVDDEVVEEQEDVGLATVADYLGGLTWEPKKSNLSAFCILSTTAHVGAGSPASLSGHHLRTPESRFSMSRALIQKATESVHTSDSFTLISPVTPRFFGGSTPMRSFQMTVGALPASLQQPEIHATETFAALQDARVDESPGNTSSTTHWRSATA